LTTLLAIYDNNDNLLQRFEYADHRMPVAMTQGSDKFYLHYDQVGSLRAITDSSHTVVKEIVYDTYGNILTDSNPSFKVPFGFAGGLHDVDTKLTRFGYRDYDAYIGKWTAKDPIGFAGGDSNLYGYVLGDPVNFVDPEGLHKKDKWYGYNNKDFQKWFHRCWKRDGNPDAGKEEIEEAYAEWLRHGSPKGGKCGNSSPENKCDIEDDVPTPPWWLLPVRVIGTTGAVILGI